MSHEMEANFVGEIWKELRENPTYHISNYGRIKSFYRDKVFGHILKPKLWGDCYATVDIRLGNVRKNTYIHKLVAQYFLPPPPSEKHSLVVHLDWDKTNNTVENLQWATFEDVFARMEVKFDKVKHYFRVLSKQNGARLNSQKITAADVEDIRKMLKNGVTGKKLAKMYNISEMQVSRIRRHENWAGIGEPLGKAG